MFFKVYKFHYFLFRGATYGENLTVGHSLHLVLHSRRHAHKLVCAEHLRLVTHGYAHTSAPYKEELVHRRMAVPLSLLPFTNAVTAICVMGEATSPFFTSTRFMPQPCEVDTGAIEYKFFIFINIYISL